MEKLQRELYQDLEAYIRKHWVPDMQEDAEEKKGTIPASDVPGEKASEGIMPQGIFGEDLEKGDKISTSPSQALSLDDLIREVGMSFHEALFEKIRESGMTDVEVYRRANMDRKLFSKIRNNPAYHPRKDTVLALAIALKLELSEAEEFLARAEYAFSPGSKSDVIIRYFIERRIFDIHTINIALYEYGLPVLE